MKVPVSLSINGNIQTRMLDPEKPLLWVLRDDLKMTGTKFGCGKAQCGACTVHMDGQPTRSCVRPVSSVVNREITTIENIADTPLGERVRAAWHNLNVPQCGYCQSGQIMAVVALLRVNSNPSDDDIDEALSGNICRCGTYPRIRAAIHAIAAGEF